MSDKTNHTKILLWIAIPVFVIMIVLILIQWRSLHKNIADIKTQNENAYNKILNAKSVSAFQIDFTKLNKQQILIDPREIEKINNHINALTQSVQKESNRAESIIEKDLDRLNLYMAIGIGFMTLLGIFIPILINVLSVQDLKDKQNGINKEFEVLKGESEKLAGMASSIRDIDKKVKEVSPHLRNLILQNTIARFFNISSIVITNAIRNNDFTEFIALLEAIKESFIGCKDDKDHTVLGNKEFIQTIRGFILYLETERFRFQTIFGSKEESKSFEELITCLNKLKDSSADNESENYDKVNEQINSIIEVINRRHS